MLFCRHHHHRLASLARSSPRTLSTNTNGPSSEDSIFTTSESPWDHVFADIDPLPLPSVRGPSRLAARSGASPPGNALLRRPSRARRQAMTAQEINAFDEMFNMIFNAVSDRQAVSKTSRLPDHSPPSIGPSSAMPLSNVFRTLRRQSSRARWTTASDEELDRKKEEMGLCDTDQELLEWAEREVFCTTKKCVVDAPKTLESATSTCRNSDNNAKDKGTSSSSKSSVHALPLQPLTYPHLLAHLMKLFRTTYSNPSLSLCIFMHASRLSIPSYVFGCTAPVYNELIQAKWEGWGDLAGVCAALEEMRLNGVRGDGLTRTIVEKIRREVAQARPSELGGNSDVVAGSSDPNLLASRLWDHLGETGVVRLLTRIEHLARKETVCKPRASKDDKGLLTRESWKTEVLDLETKNDSWEFDSWSRRKKSKGKADKEKVMDMDKRRGDPPSDIHGRTPSVDDWIDLDSSNVAYQ
ncbi:hypothetical protein ID866_1069 [Astraeus odoratus]|nr:hypothetical protein ID866_1069 [Astraeus odoratus]